jgi:hypothetical protein
MEDEIRHMASEIECEGIPDPGVEQPTAESPPEERALSSTDERETEGSIPDQAGNQASETPHDEGGEVAAKDVAPPVRLNRPGEANSLAAAHEAFSRAIRAHAEAKGLSLIDQTSFLQVLHRPTGQKIYFGLQTKTATVHVETTLPIVGQFGAVAKSDNGKIQAMIDFPVTDGDELTNIISLIDMLASGHFGPLPPARSKKASQPAQ